MKGLTGFKLSETVFVSLRYIVDPAGNRKTNRQHIPDTQEEMTETVLIGWCELLPIDFPCFLTLQYNLYGSYLCKDIKQAQEA